MTSVKVVVFRCGNEEYAIPVDQVVSIEKLEQISPIPHLPDYFLGLMKIRGELVPIVDFEQILYARSALAGEQSRIIVLQTEDMFIGLLVLEAKEILDIQETDLKQIGLVNYIKTQYFSSVANLENRMITLIDPTILVRTVDGIKEIQAHMESVKAEI